MRLLLIICVFYSTHAFAKDKTERDYQEEIAKIVLSNRYFSNEQIEALEKSGNLLHRLGEVKTSSEKRVDLLIDNYTPALNPKQDKFACEIDWCDKWAEGIGQSLYYGMEFKCQSVLILLYSGKSTDKLNIEIAKRLGDKYNVLIWVYDTNKGNFFRDNTCPYYQTTGVEIKPGHFIY